MTEVRQTQFLTPACGAAPYHRLRVVGRIAVAEDSCRRSSAETAAARDETGLCRVDKGKKALEAVARSVAALSMDKCAVRKSPAAAAAAVAAMTRVLCPAHCCPFVLPRDGSLRQRTRTFQGKRVDRPGGGVVVVVVVVVGGGCERLVLGEVAGRGCTSSDADNSFESER